MEKCKVLKLQCSYKELAAMLETTPKTLRKEIRINMGLFARLKEMGLVKHQRPLKKHVIEIFKYFGFPEGYEHYERENEQPIF